MGHGNDKNVFVCHEELEILHLSALIMEDFIVCM